ncbi:MAG: hypothetical protein AAFR60_09985, partial [Pseudomonadota bacterium]
MQRDVDIVGLLGRDRLRGVRRSEKSSPLGVRALSRASAIFACAAFAVVVFASFAPIGPAHAAPQRVVSVNLCTDQLAMLLASEQ